MSCDAAGEPADKKKSDERKSWRKDLVEALTSSKDAIFHRRSRREADASKEQEICEKEPLPTFSGLSAASFRTFKLDTPSRRWLSSFGRCDPRWQILKFFNDMALEGAQNLDDISAPVDPVLKAFAKASVFTVWRPTSAIAIQRMISGEATGKGLEIKGKSAKAGKLSGFVPYLQIYEEEHKTKVKTLPRSGRTRIFYASKEARDAVVAELQPLQNQILNVVQEAKRTVRKTALVGLSPLRPVGRMIMSAGAQAGSAATGLGSAIGHSIGADIAMSGVKKSVDRVVPVESLRSSFAKSPNEDEREWALKRLLWDMDDPSIRRVDEYSPQYYGIELPDRLLWQGCVADSDISRPEGSDFYTARPSQPAFQDMNFIAISKTRKNTSETDGPRVVLWQTCGSELKDKDPMDPRGLIMAYEEHGRVLPVVSDFDCFTMGTRGVAYETPLPEEQVDLLQWCISQIERVLDEQRPSSRDLTWTSRWLGVLKSSAIKGFHPTVPRFGFGDGKSYAIMESAVTRLKENGAVRHGAECFNYYFPQELDDEFLIVSDRLPGKVPWKYVDARELRQFLLQKIDEGFTFPLNPKWVLCDEGWKEIYDGLMSSDKPNVQDSLDIWFPRSTGVREKIEAISASHPKGFVCGKKDVEMSGTEAMDLATLELEKYLAFRRAKVKIRAVLAFNSMLDSIRKDAALDEEEVNEPIMADSDEE